MQFLEAYKIRFLLWLCAFLLLNVRKHFVSPELGNTGKILNIPPFHNSNRLKIYTTVHLNILPWPLIPPVYYDS